MPALDRRQADAFWHIAKKGVERIVHPAPCTHG
jgi:hypothetical protein